MPFEQTMNFSNKTNERTMNIKSFFIPVLALMALIGCSSPETSQHEADSADGAEVVRVMTLDYSEIDRSTTHTAHLEAFQSVHLASASPGRIEKIHTDVGNKVARGQLLVEMDKTQLHQAQVQLNSIETDYRRVDTLRKVGSISEQQYDQIKTQYEMAVSNVAFLEENTRLQAPFPATVSERYYEEGEMFTAAPNTPEGKAAILSLVNIGRLKALVNVPERFFPMIKTGMEVKISADVYPGEEFTGSVTRVYPAIDPASRSFRVELTVPNRDELLRPGMFARARIALDQVDALVVPALAVLKLQGSDERYVFLEENGRAKRVVVEIGQRFDDMVEIISDDVSAGDRLIIAGQARLLDGVSVQVQE